MSRALLRSDRARCLRKNMTEAERKLWYRVRQDNTPSPLSPPIQGGE